MTAAEDRSFGFRVAAAGFALDTDRSTASVVEGSGGGAGQGRLIAHGIARRRVRWCGLPLALTTTTLLVAMSFASHGTVAIASTNLCELHAAGQSSATARAVFLAAIAGATDSELKPALAAPLEPDGLDAAPPAPASFTRRRTSHRHRQRLRSLADRARNLGHHVDDHLQVDADVQRDEAIFSASSPRCSRSERRDVRGRDHPADTAVAVGSDRRGTDPTAPQRERLDPERLARSAGTSSTRSYPEAPRPRWGYPDRDRDPR